MLFFSTTLVMSTLNLVLEKGEHTLHYITVRYCMSTILFFIQGQLISASSKPRWTMCHVYVITLWDIPSMNIMGTKCLILATVTAVCRSVK